MSRLERVVLVNARDRAIGTAPRLAVHRDGRLHRAVSVFILDDSAAILLQRRAKSKEVAPGLWSNTCCTHPRPGERAATAAKRRLFEELRLSCRLRPAFDFTYRAEFAGGWIEHEYDHVFVGRCIGDPKPEPSEVADWNWMSIADLRKDLRRRPNRYTPWLRISLPSLLEHMAERHHRPR